MKKQVIEFAAVLYDVRTKRDGGGRVQLDFGADALLSITELQKLNARGDINLQVVIVPFGEDTGEIHDDFEPDETGEIQI